MARGQINPITRRLWDRGLTWQKWSELNDFKKRYAELVGAGKAGKWQAGTARKIQRALIDQGLTTEEELLSLINDDGRT